ncbi:MAG: PKD domain-containing protein [Thermoproteota archaeon]
MVALAKGTKWAIIFAGIGVAAGVGITVAFLQPQGIQQREVVYGDDNPWLDPLFLQNYRESLRTGAHYKSVLAVGEEGFFYAAAKGGKEPYQFEWRFSDGVVLTAQNATRSFDSPGTYSAVLTVNDADGQKKESNISVKVQ